MSNDPKDAVVDYEKLLKSYRQSLTQIPITNIPKSSKTGMSTKCNESEGLVGKENFTCNDKNNQVKND